MLGVACGSLYSPLAQLAQAGFSRRCVIVLLGVPSSRTRKSIQLPLESSAAIFGNLEIPVLISS